MNIDILIKRFITITYQNLNSMFLCIERQKSCLPEAGQVSFNIMNTSVCVTFFAYVTNVNNKHSWGKREMSKTGIALSSKMHFFIQGLKNVCLFPLVT